MNVLMLYISYFHPFWALICPICSLCLLPALATCSTLPQTNASNQPLLCISPLSCDVLISFVVILTCVECDPCMTDLSAMVPSMSTQVLSI